MQLFSVQTSVFTGQWILIQFSLCTSASRVSYQCSNSLSINLRGQHCSVGNNNASKVYITSIVQKPPHCPETPLHCPETPTEISLSENPHHCPETPTIVQKPPSLSRNPPIVQKPPKADERPSGTYCFGGICVKGVL